jgi:hypothetical protein
MPPLLTFFLITLAILLVSAIFFHILVRLGSFGQRACDACAKAPLLDLIVFYFCHGPHIAAVLVWWNIHSAIAIYCDLILPPVIGSAADATALPRSVDANSQAADWLASWGGLFTLLAVSIAAQAATLVLWSWFHEAINPGIRKGPRIVSTLNRRVGWFRNHAAVWWTALAVPLFTLIRLAEIFLYPPLHWLVRLPKYNTAEWINISRQKFSGLVGYDLIWCLYCDWMTGVWSLGSEMLRNVESFWCPIKYTSPEKCEKCCIDFPDIEGGWVDAKGNIADVAKVLEEKYPGPNGDNGWFGHPSRANLTIEGKKPKP